MCVGSLQGLIESVIPPAMGSRGRITRSSSGSSSVSTTQEVTRFDEEEDIPPPPPPEEDEDEEDMPPPPPPPPPQSAVEDDAAMEALAQGPEIEMQLHDYKVRPCQLPYLRSESEFVFVTSLLRRFVASLLAVVPETLLVFDCRLALVGVNSCWDPYAGPSPRSCS